MESLRPPHEGKPPPSFPNGALKKQQQQPAVGAEANVGYRECLKNHAASLGGHAVDGCGEFMPSVTSDPGVPASLTCAACGCHRNFHRRALRLRHHGHEPSAGGATTGHDDADDSADEDDEGAFQHLHQRRRLRSRSPPPYYSSAPGMLLALSGGAGGPVPLARASPATAAPRGGEQLHRRRARTKFSPEQKSRMHELSEKLGWRMPKRDDGTVEEFCRSIGVERGVFKVWMHNNKQIPAAGSSGGMHSSRAAADDVGGHGDEGNGVGFSEKNGLEGKFAPQGSSPTSP